MTRAGRPARWIRALVAVTVLILAGCQDPYTNDKTSRRASGENARGTNAAPASGEQPGRIPAAVRRRLARPALPAAHTARAALIRYATTATTWTAATVVARYRELAGQAVGLARQEAQQTAASARDDPQLNASVRSQGRVEGLIAQADGWALVVLTEAVTLESGEQPERRIRVARAHTRRLGAGHVVDRWEPQP